MGLTQRSKRLRKSMHVEVMASLRFDSAHDSLKRNLANMRHPDPFSSVNTIVIMRTRRDYVDYSSTSQKMVFCAHEMRSREP